MKIEEYDAGQKVRYHPIIGEPHDGKIYTTTANYGVVGGIAVAWLEEKPGFVAMDALSILSEHEYQEYRRHYEP